MAIETIGIKDNSMSFVSRFLSFALLVTVLFSCGCQPPRDPMLDLLDVDLTKTKQDDLIRTMALVDSEIRFEQKEFSSNMSTGLNRWAETRGGGLDDQSWREDELTNELMAASGSLDIAEGFKDLSFFNTDGYYIQQSNWISQIANRVTEPEFQMAPFELYRMAADNYKPDEDVELPLIEVVKKLHPEMGNDAGQTVANSMSVFDWVVRNIQLLPDSILTHEEKEEARLNESKSAAAAGIPGVGYQRYPWQSLLYGQGDYVDRAKIFILGLRELGIDSVMLATQGESGSPVPWAVGVVVGENYYLFDTKLGLPILGEKFGSIATLDQVRENPELITSLSLTNEESLADNTEYWVKPGQLGSLVSLVYTSPESVSKRMSNLEAALPKDLRTDLAFTTGEIAARLPGKEGVTVEPWGVGFQTHEFRQAIRNALEKKSDDVIAAKLNDYYINEFYIDNFVVYRTARARFFKGKFGLDSEGRSLNAIQSFQRLKYTQEQIDNLGSDSDQQRRLGIRKEAEQNVTDFNTEVRSVQGQMDLIRRDAGLFLAQCHFDNGSMNAAANWLENIKAEDGVDRWNDGVTYLLGRSQEKLKDYDQAIEIFSSDQLQQSHGNLIRARMLKEIVNSL
jgi:tetratricopeptide (TPR) repeat protein